MVDNKIENLQKQMQIKVNGFIKQAHELGQLVKIFEGKRTLQRQRELYAIGRTTDLDKKPVTRTLESKHLTGDAVDIVYIIKGGVTRKGDYKLLAKIGRCYGLETIRQEQCHFQDNGTSINNQMIKNSATWLISDEFGRKLLKNANIYFRSIK